MLESGLEGREYLAGPGKGTYTIADIANFCWVCAAHVIWAPSKLGLACHNLGPFSACRFYRAAVRGAVVNPA